MAFYEAECKKKNDLIGALKEELALYQKNSREKDYKLILLFVFALTTIWSHKPACFFVLL